MINVRGIANAAIQPVNQNITGNHYASTGYTTNAAGARVPTYAAAAPVALQVQAAKGSDLKHVNGLNLQSIYRNVRVWGNAQGVSRPNVRGGDLFQFPEVPAGTLKIWLVVGVLETWAEWCSVVVCLQDDAGPPT